MKHHAISDFDGVVLELTYTAVLPDDVQNVEIWDFDQMNLVESLKIELQSPYVRWYLVYVLTTGGQRFIRVLNQILSGHPFYNLNDGTAYALYKTYFST